MLIIQKFIEKYGTKANVLILFILMILINTMVFPIIMPMGQTPIDLTIGYTPESVYALIASYPEEVRKAYLFGELTADIIYPVIFSSLFGFSIYLIYKSSKLAILALPLLLADFAENAGIVTMLYNYPEQLETVAWITSIFTSLKWLLLIGLIGIIIWGLTKNLVVKVRNS